MIQKPNNIYITKGNFGVDAKYIMGNRLEDFGYLLNNVINKSNSGTSIKEGFESTAITLQEVREFFSLLYGKNAKIDLQGSPSIDKDRTHNPRMAFVEKTNVTLGDLEDLALKMTSWSRYNNAQKTFRTHIICTYLKESGALTVTEKFIMVKFMNMGIPTFEMMESEFARAHLASLLANTIMESAAEFAKKEVSYTINSSTLAKYIDKAYKKIKFLFRQCCEGYGNRHLIKRFAASITLYPTLNTSGVLPTYVQLIRSNMNIFVETAGEVSTLAKKNFTVEQERQINLFCKMWESYDQISDTFKLLSKQSSSILRNWLQVISTPDYHNPAFVSNLSLRLGFSSAAVEISSVEKFSVAKSIEKTVNGKKTKVVDTASLIIDPTNAGQGINNFVRTLLTSYGVKAIMDEVMALSQETGSNIETFSDLSDAVTLSLFVYIAYEMAEEISFFEGTYKPVFIGAPVRRLAKTYSNQVRYNQSNCETMNPVIHLILCTPDNNVNALPHGIPNIVGLVPKDVNEAVDTMFVGLSSMIASRKISTMQLGDLNGGIFSAAFDVFEVIGGFVNSDTLLTSCHVIRAIDSASHTLRKRHADIYEDRDLMREHRLKIISDARVYASNAILSAYTKEGIELPTIINQLQNEILMLNCVNVYISMVARFFPNMARWMLRLAFTKDKGEFFHFLNNNKIHFFGMKTSSLRG